MKAIFLAGIDLVSLGVLFWLVPTVIAKVMRRKIAGDREGYISVVLKHLPGAVTGAFVAVLAFYLFGMSYEEFAARTARGVGDRALAYFQVDETSRCIARMTEKYKMTADAITSEASAQQLLQTSSERDRIISEVRGSLLFRSEPSLEAHMDYGLLRFCEEFGLNYPTHRRWLQE